MGGITAEDEIAFTVVPADLVAWQLAGEDEPDPAELDPGLFVCVNVDDAPQNLQTLTLDVLSDDQLADQVQIAWTNDVKIDVFSDAQGTAPVVSEEERTFDLADPHHCVVVARPLPAQKMAWARLRGTRCGAVGCGHLPRPVRAA